ncbi:MAG: ribonuclease D [Caulobacteraceae bacterium]
MTPITTTAELARFCARLEGKPFVAVDTEFMRESTYWPRLCLVQAASEDAEAVIDPLAPGIDLEPFLETMRDTAILKVFHAARQDVEILYNLKAMPAPLFDTQVAGMAAGFPEQVAYDVLVRQMLGAEVDKSSRFTDWARRPLSEAQLTYALADVTHLAKLYPMLRARLEESGRLGWVMEEMAALLEPALYDTEPENAWKRLKPRRHSAKYLSILRALAAWRERTAQTRDQPRGRVLKDDAIDELATQAPTDVESLDRLRSLPRGFSGSRYAKEVLDVVREGIATAEHQPVEPKRVAKHASAPTGAVVELLKVLLKARSEDAHVASKLIATVSDLERIAADDESDTPALHGWRREAFGEDALKLKRGEIALMLDAGKVRVVEVRRRPRTEED